ncbi:MAG: 50S ribosomal protein L17 [Candidatus Riflebacteria bacterium]|nr:50S ribosomal protein L17 [Candidatus Riflebacteria bacterium]
MEEKRFQKQKLNRDDHKKVDKGAKGVRAGIGIASALAVVATAAVKYGPAIVKKIANK